MALHLVKFVPFLVLFYFIFYSNPEQEIEIVYRAHALSFIRCILLFLCCRFMRQAYLLKIKRNPGLIRKFVWSAYCLTVGYCIIRTFYLIYQFGLVEEGFTKYEISNLSPSWSLSAIIYSCKGLNALCRIFSLAVPVIVVYSF